MAKEIPLTQGKVAIVDDGDFCFLAQWKWYICNGYAMRRVKNITGAAHYPMHSQIMHPPFGYLVDHINGDKLDNQRSNLRICTKAENCRNTKTRRDKKTSLYRGVCLVKDKIARPWRAKIVHEQKAICIGHFATEIEAALAYNEAATRLHGEFARLNVIELPTV